MSRRSARRSASLSSASTASSVDSWEDRVDDSYVAMGEEWLREVRDR